MWIETMDIELVNLDRIGRICVMSAGAGRLSEVVAYTGTMDNEGNEIEYVLSRGTLTECTAMYAALKERLRGGARKLTG